MAFKDTYAFETALAGEDYGTCELIAHEHKVLSDKIAEQGKHINELKRLATNLYVHLSSIILQKTEVAIHSNKRRINEGDRLYERYVMKHKANEQALN